MANLLEQESFHAAFRAFREGQTAGLNIGSPHLELAHARVLMREKLETRLGNFWISPDIAINETTIVPAGGMVRVHIRLDLVDLAALTDFHIYALSCLKATTRSRFAQLGLEVLENAPTEIAATRYITEDENEKKLGAVITVLNHAQRPILLSEGTKFFYMYYWNNQTVTGQELTDLLGHDIHISGKEGETWRWWCGPEATGRLEDRQGFELFIDEESRSYIPPSDEPMTIDDGRIDNHNRQGVDYYLVKPVPTQTNQLLWIAETMAVVNIKQGFHGIVDMAVSHNSLPIGSHETDDFQTNSQIVKGGHNDHRIRTEILSTTIPGKTPKTSLLRVARKGGRDINFHNK